MMWFLSRFVWTDLRNKEESLPFPLLYITLFLGYVAAY